MPRPLLPPTHHSSFAAAPEPRYRRSSRTSSWPTSRLGIRVFSVPEGQGKNVVRALSNHPQVTFAELSVPRLLGIPCDAADGDCTVPSDGLPGRRWDLHNDGTIKDSQGNVLENVGPVPDADMDWLEAFDQLGQFTGSAVLGVVDTGIYCHPRRADKSMWRQGSAAWISFPVPTDR